MRRGSAHSMPESASALWRMVSLTAAKTRRMFEVSVACVRLQDHGVSVATRKVYYVFIRSNSLQLAMARMSSMDAFSHVSSRINSTSKRKRNSLRI